MRLGTLLVGLMLVTVIVLPRWIALGTQGPNYAPPSGALNLNVTQANIATTICVRGWTATVRPPKEWTDNLKRVQMRERHLPGTPYDYQEDHLIPLELAGAPRDLRNLWPERWSEARIKDRAEYRLNRDVCAGRITLDEAQREIRNPSNWR